MLPLRSVWPVVAADTAIGTTKAAMRAKTVTKAKIFFIFLLYFFCFFVLFFRVSRYCPYGFANRPKLCLSTSL